MDESATAAGVTQTIAELDILVVTLYNRRNALRLYGEVVPATEMERNESPSRYKAINQEKYLTIVRYLLIRSTSLRENLECIQAPELSMRSYREIKKPHRAGALAVS